MHASCIALCFYILWTHARILRSIRRQQNPVNGSANLAIFKNLLQISATDV